MYFAQAPHQKKIWKIKTSDVEIHELLKAWFFVSLAFTILLNGFSFGLGTGLIFIIAATTVGTGFLLHELMPEISCRLEMPSGASAHNEYVHMLRYGLTIFFIQRHELPYILFFFTICQ